MSQTPMYHDSGQDMGHICSPETLSMPFVITNLFSKLPLSKLANAPRRKADSTIETVIPQIGLHIQCNPYQDPNCLFCRNYQADPKDHMEMQGTQNSQNNFENEQSWRTHTSLFLN